MMKLLTNVDLKLIVGGLESKAHMAGEAVATAIHEDIAFLGGVGDWLGGHIYDWTH